MHCPYSHPWQLCIGMSTYPRYSEWVLPGTYWEACNSGSTPAMGILSHTTMHCQTGSMTGCTSQQVKLNTQSHDVYIQELIPHSETPTSSDRNTNTCHPRYDQDSFSSKPEMIKTSPERFAMCCRSTTLKNPLQPIPKPLQPLFQKISYDLNPIFASSRPLQLSEALHRNPGCHYVESPLKANSRKGLFTLRTESKMQTSSQCTIPLRPCTALRHPKTHRSEQSMSEIF